MRILTILTLCFGLTLAAACGPEPGDSCSDYFEETCSGGGDYVLQCEETPDGELHWFIERDCSSEFSECRENDEGDPYCE